MQFTCPWCQRSLKFKENQSQKIRENLSKLKPGMYLKFGCPLCKNTVELDRDGTPVQPKAKPAPPQPAQPAAPPAQSAPSPPPQSSPKPKVPSPLTPPTPPDIGWLTSGKFDESKAVEDVKSALILIKDPDAKENITKILSDDGFEPVFPSDIDDAIERMQFKEFSIIIFHLNFEGQPFAESNFHNFMRQLAMNKRRYIQYILIGPDFKTLYDLEAIAYSANLVINENELPHFNILYKKTTQDYEALFGPYIDMLTHHSKR